MRGKNIEKGPAGLDQNWTDPGLSWTFRTQISGVRNSGLLKFRSLQHPAVFMDSAKNKQINQFSLKTNLTLEI